MIHGMMQKNNITVRGAVLADIPHIALLERECFSAPWSENALLETMKQENSVFLVAEHDGEIFGYVGSYHAAGEGYITNVAVSAGMRRKGVGRALICALKEKAKEYAFSFLTLEVRVGNLPAIALYESLGFESLGRRPRFYSNPVEDAYIMTWNIT